MDKIKKYLIRGISIIMVAIVLVVSPASDYLDTQGIGDTHAMGAVGGLVTLEALLTVAGLAYGVYVDNVHQSTLADELTASVERKGLVDVIPSITKLKQGVTEFVITEAFLYAIKDFFETEKAIDLSSGSECVLTGVYPLSLDTLPDTTYSSNFVRYLDSLNHANDIYVTWNEDSKYSSGVYKVYRAKWIDSVIDVNDYAYHSFVEVYNFDGYALYYIAYDSDNKALGSNRSVFYNSYAYDEDTSSWKQIYESSSYQYKSKSVFENVDYIKMLEPVYKTMYIGMASVDSMTFPELLTYCEPYNVATSYGSYDEANLDKLKGLTVTENQLVAVQNDLFPQIDEQRELQASAQTIADLISFQLADSLSKNFAIAPDDGETDTPTDTPTDGVTVGEQAIIDQSVANATGIKGAIQSATQAITDFFTAPLQGIKTVLDNIYTTLTGVVSGVVEGVKTGVKAILTELFVPDTAELEQAVSSMTEKFAFADSLITLAEDIGAKVSNVNGPPVIYIDFGESEDERFQSIGRLVAVDFAWYERYKPYGDSILSAVLWVFFILRMLRGAPSIFKGIQTGNDVGTTPTLTPFNVPQIEERK